MFKKYFKKYFQITNHQLPITGFTLIELLVVVAILGILSTIGLSSFHSSQMKSRDARRKVDLANIQKALEMHYNDHKKYPASDVNGQIVVDGAGALVWGDKSEFKDSTGTIYMKELPNDPAQNQIYYYLSSDGKSYKLYAKLENTNDLCFTSSSNCSSGGFAGTDCGGGSRCNYGVSSANVNT